VIESNMVFDPLDPLAELDDDPFPPAPTVTV
jgi:hypothetical protein